MQFRAFILIDFKDQLNAYSHVIYTFLLFIAESFTNKSRNGSFRKKNRFSLAIMSSTKKANEEDAEST